MSFMGILKSDTKKLPDPNIEPCFLNHPHLRKMRSNNDTLYIASEKLSFDDRYPGWGVFSFDNSLVLTKEGSSRSQWRLKELIGEQTSKEPWKGDYFQSSPIGQAFVIAEPSKSVTEWVKQLAISNCEKTAKRSL